MSTRHIGHHHRHMVSYPFSLRQSLYTLVVVPLLALVVAIFFLRTFGSISVTPEHITLTYVLEALGATFVRLLIAYAIALVFSLPMALLVTWSTAAERIFLPLFDIMQSVPVLAFFPVVIVLFAHYNFFNGAAIFILLITMMWSIVFSVVGGLRVIPQDIKEASQIFHVKGF